MRDRMAGSAADQRDVGGSGKTAAIRGSPTRSGHRSVVLGRTGRDGEGVDRARELVGQDGIDRALALDARLTAKRIGDDLDPEMRLALGPRADMAGMEVRFVDHVGSAAASAPVGPSASARLTQDKSRPPDVQAPAGRKSVMMP